MRELRRHSDELARTRGADELAIVEERDVEGARVHVADAKEELLVLVHRPGLARDLLWLLAVRLHIVCADRRRAQDSERARNWGRRGGGRDSHSYWHFGVRYVSTSTGLTLSTSRVYLSVILIRYSVGILSAPGSVGHVPETQQRNVPFCDFAP